MLPFTDSSRAPSLTRTVLKGIQEIRDNGWVVKESDKNLGLVLMEKSIYNHLLSTQLDPEDFKQVPSFPHLQIYHHLKRILAECGAPRTFAEKHLDYAKQHSEACPFYILPKIHKPSFKARPITAQHSYMLSELSRELAKILNQKCDGLPAIAKDSTQAIVELEHVRLPHDNSYGSDIVLVTYDVEACCPSLNIADTLCVLLDAYPDVFSSNGCFGARILELIMKNSYFKVNKRYYIQLRGSAMGTAVAKPFANLYLHYKFYPTLRAYGKQVIFHRRYVDDGFAILRSSAGAEHFLKDLETCSNLTITTNWSFTSAIFLDFEAYKGPRFGSKGILDVRIYIKPISKLLYQHGRSNHPHHTFTGVTKGKMIRFLRNTSDRITRNIKIKELFHHLAQRGYNATWLRECKKLISSKHRHKYLTPAIKPKEPPSSWLITNYEPTLKNRWISLRKCASFYL